RRAGRRQMGAPVTVRSFSERSVGVCMRRRAASRRGGCRELDSCSARIANRSTVGVAYGVAIRPPSVFLIAIVSLALGCRGAEVVPESQELDDGRQWLDTRTLPTPTAPALLRAAAANARN